MIEIVAKSGKKIGKIADNASQEDKIVVKGREINLSDAYANDEIKDAFNKEIRDLRDDNSSED